MKKALVSLGLSSLVVTLTLVSVAFASVSDYTVSSFSKYCSQNATICNKVDAGDNKDSLTVRCPSSGQSITSVYVHAGDKDTVYQLPDSKWNAVYSSDNSSVTVSKNGDQHDLSWVAVVCSNSSPTPSPSCTPSPSPTCSPSPRPSPSPTVTPTPLPSSSPTGTPTPSPTVSPSPTVTPVPTTTPTPTPVSSPSPTPVTTPVPTSTPVPGLGKQSKTAVSDPICVGQNFDVKIELMLDGNPVKDTQVKFVYNGEAKYAKTGADGWAGVAYGFVDGKDEVDFYPEDGYPAQIQHIIKSSSCKVPAVLGISTASGKSGQVLGASTLGKTGALEDAIFNMVGLTGAGCTTLGSLLYAKKTGKKTSSRR